MSRLRVSNAASIWLVLCGLSVFSVMQLAKSEWSWAVTVLIVSVAAVKARLVIHHYMEADRARAVWRTLYNVWNVAAAATIIIGYMLAWR